MAKDYIINIDFSSLSFSFSSLTPPFICIIPLPVCFGVRVSTMHRLPRMRYRDDEPAVPSRVIILIDVASGIIQSTPVTFPIHEGTALLIGKVNMDELGAGNGGVARSIVLTLRRGNYQRSSLQLEDKDCRKHRMTRARDSRRVAETEGPREG